MFDFGSMLNAVGMGKKVISPEAQVMSPGQAPAGGGMFNFGNLFGGGGGDAAAGGGSGLSSILKMFSGAANQQGQPQQTQAPIATPAINVSNPAPAGTALTDPKQKNSGRLEKLSLSSLLRGGNNNGIQ